MTTRTLHKLTDKMVKNCPKGERPHDGGGLYSNNKNSGQPWEYQFNLNGERKIMGLGGYPAISLSEARVLHKAAIVLVRQGINPIDVRKAERQINAAALTVMEATEAYIEAMNVDWKTARYADQIRERLNTYVKPIIGDLPIADIGLAEAKQVLVPIWNTIRPTAKRIRQHLERAVDWAIAEGKRKDVINPFQIRLLKHSLSFAKQETTHFASLSYDQASEFFAKLRAYDGIKARALEFVMLNAVRVADVCGGGKHHSEPMKWSHVDIDAKLWTVPDTKTGKPHTVPLSDAAMAVLGQMRQHRDPSTDYVFPGAVRGTVIADSTLRYLIADMGYKGLATTHGMRATFKTWAEEVMSFDKGVIEAALAHTQGKLDAAYHRGSYLEKRRQLMGLWADYLEGRVADVGNNVVALRG